MATNLRLRAEAEAAVRAEATRTGRSQQELIREAVDRYLGLGQADPPRTSAETLVATGRALPPRAPYRELSKPLDLPAGASTLGLLARDERF